MDLLERSLLIWDDHLGADASVDTDLAFLDRFFASGVSYLSINVGYDVKPWPDTFKVIGAYRSWVEARPERYRLVGTVEELEAARREGAMALTFDLEGMGPLGGDVALIRVYHALGVRQIALAYNRNNAFAGGCHDDDGGLSELGLRALSEMNRLGILVDLSHTGYRSTMETIERSSAPVIFSHSNPRALREHARNIGDDQIRGCAATGGVIGVNGIGLFLGDGDDLTDAIVRHISYVADLVGVAHVGIGLDTYPNEEPGGEDLLAENAYYWPPGNGYELDRRVAAPEQLPKIGRALGECGFSDADVAAIMGGNFFRVAAAVWGGATERTTEKGGA